MNVAIIIGGRVSDFLEGHSLSDVLITDPRQSAVETLDFPSLGDFYDGENFSSIPPLSVRKADLRRAADVRRDELCAAPFAYDFGSTIALTAQGMPAEQSAPAGVRELQCRPLDLDNWGKLYSRASRLVAQDLGAAIIPMRCEDNWNVQTTANQVLAALDSLFDRNAGLLFYGGAIKDLGDLATDSAAMDAVEAILAQWAHAPSA